jgi:hypothetical protein
MPSTSAVCRTVVVLAYLVLVAVAGHPTWTTALAGFGLVAAWLAPLVLAHRRQEVPDAAAALALQPEGAGLT